MSEKIKYKGKAAGIVRPYMPSFPFDKQNTEEEQATKYTPFHCNIPSSIFGGKGACIPESIVIYMHAIFATTIAANVSSKMDRSHCSPWFGAGATASTWKQKSKQRS
jgi:hypothetical protein